MSEQQPLSTDPRAGLGPPTTEEPPQAAGYWENKGIAGQVWHPASGASERGREDNSLLGMPPELAAVSAAGLARALAAPAVSAGARALAGVRNIAAQATPAIKYEVTKTLLEKSGVPSSIAIPTAMVVSGYKRGAKTAAEPVAEVPAGPVTPPDRLLTVADRPAGPITGSIPPALRRPSGTPEAEALLRQSAPPATAAPVATASPVEAPPVVPTPSAAPIASGSPPASPGESVPAPLTAFPEAMKEYVRLVRAGKTPKEALQLMMQQMELAQRLGAPTGEAMQAAIAKRNATGRWPE